MDGYKTNGRKVSDYSSYEDGYIFYCQKSIKCNSEIPGFDDKGHLVAEGKVTAINYSATKSAGSLAIFRNYENAIKELGGRMLSYNPDHEGVHVFLLDNKVGKVWVVLENNYGRNYKLTLIEAKTMQQVVKAGQLADEMARQGYATLYINFDHDKAEIKAEARPALDEVVAMLKSMPATRISVEGHTDNVGNAPANQKLSQARARSVMEALTAAGIEARRLQSKGLGSGVPIADNRTEEGRAKNRRVELVRLK